MRLTLLAATASNKVDRLAGRSPATSSSLDSWRSVINPETGGCHRRPRRWGGGRGSNSSARRETFLRTPYGSAARSVQEAPLAKHANGPGPGPGPGPLLCLGPSSRVRYEPCVPTAAKEQHRAGSISSSSARGSSGKFVRCWEPHSSIDNTAISHGVRGSLAAGICDAPAAAVLGPTPPDGHVTAIADQECGASPRRPSMPKTGALAPATPARLAMVFDEASSCCRKRGRGHPHNRTTTATATINTSTAKTNTTNTTITTTGDAKPKYFSTTTADHHHSPQNHHNHNNPQTKGCGDVWIPQQYFPGRLLASPRGRKAMDQTDWTPAAAVELTPNYHPVRQTTPGKDYRLVRRTDPRRKRNATRCTNGSDFSPEEHGARSRTTPTQSCVQSPRRSIESGALFSQGLSVQAPLRCGGGDGGGGSYVRYSPPVQHGLEASSGPSIVSPPSPSPFLAHLLEDAATISGGDDRILNLHRGDMEELLEDAKGFIGLTGTGVVAEVEAGRHELRPDNQNQRPREVSNHIIVGKYPVLTPHPSFQHVQSVTT